MYRFDSILLPHDGSAEACKALGCSAWLAERLDATLHVLTPAPLQLTPEVQARLVLHRAVGNPVEALRRAITVLAVKLVVLTARGASASAGIDPGRRLGTVAQALMASSTVPVLLLPLHYREVLPWTSMLVGATGEPASDHALQAALRLGAALGLELSVVCCDDPGAPPPALGSYPDAAHHEYPQRLEDMVRRSLLRSDDGPPWNIAHLLLCPGDAATQLSVHVHQRQASVLALGWHGSLARGRARVLKRFLERAEYPLLLVRDVDRPAMTLKVGESFQPAAASSS